MAIHIGSIIHLKPEFEERYVILHKHAFPEVLERIKKSNIGNYSIFLSEGLLFSYYDYYGDDLKSDLAVMTEDAHTQDWWKLTDPMQEPLADRSPGEWWSEIENIFHYETKNFSGSIKRVSLRANIQNGFNLADIIDKLPEWQGKTFSLFQKEGLIFLYTEIDSSLDENHLISRLSEAGLDWTTSREVFHTD